MGARSRNWLAGVCLSLAAGGLLSACARQETDLRSTVQLLAEEHGDVAQQAIARVLPYGDSALPYLETALHNAPPAGRRNVIMALRRLDAAKSAPLLGHIAAFDADAQVRDEAMSVLNAWAVRKSAHGDAARTALRKRDDVRGEEP